MFTLPKASIDKCGLLAPIDIHLPLGCIMVVVSLSARSVGGGWRPVVVAPLEPLFEDGLLCGLAIR